MGPRTERQATLEAREAELDDREAAVTVREELLTSRLESAHRILAAAAERDAVADARDAGAETRDLHEDRAQFLASRHVYGQHLGQRRDAALDRLHAKGNRTASQGDRIALAGVLGDL